MSKFADDGFGNLVRVDNPYGEYMQIFVKLNGKLARFDVGTTDHVIAIDAVRKDMVASYGDMHLSRARWKNGPVLALLIGRASA